MIANAVLLGVASGGDEPVGRLSPRVELASPAPGAQAATPLPRHENEPDDD
jgi:hypothetical protein